MVDDRYIRQLPDTATWNFAANETKVFSFDPGINCQGIQIQNESANALQYQIDAGTVTAFPDGTWQPGAAVFNPLGLTQIARIAVKSLVAGSATFNFDSDPFPDVPQVQRLTSYQGDQLIPSTYVPVPGLQFIAQAGAYTTFGPFYVGDWAGLEYTIIGSIGPNQGDQDWVFEWWNDSSQTLRVGYMRWDITAPPGISFRSFNMGPWVTLKGQSIHANDSAIVIVVPTNRVWEPVTPLDNGAAGDGAIDGELLTINNRSIGAGNTDIVPITPWAGPVTVNFETGTNATNFIYRITGNFAGSGLLHRIYVTFASPRTQQLYLPRMICNSQFTNNDAAARAYSSVIVPILS